MEAASGAAFAPDRRGIKKPLPRRRAEEAVSFRTGNLSRSSFLAGFRDAWSVAKRGRTWHLSCPAGRSRPNKAVARASKGLHPPPFWMSYLKHRFMGLETGAFRPGSRKRKFFSRARFLGVKTRLEHSSGAVKHLRDLPQGVAPGLAEERGAGPYAVCAGGFLYGAQETGACRRKDRLRPTAFPGSNRPRPAG